MDFEDYGGTVECKSCLIEFDKKLKKLAYERKCIGEIHRKSNLKINLKFLLPEKISFFIQEKNNLININII
ncbi:hypothetical protein LCGC14_2722460, partial [marine sediment metagenome]